MSFLCTACSQSKQHINYQSYNKGETTITKYRSGVVVLKDNNTYYSDGKTQIVKEKKTETDLQFGPTEIPSTFLK